MDNTVMEQPRRVPPQKSRGGVWVTFGDEQYRIPPLGLGAIVELQERVAALAAMRGMPTKEQLQTICEVVHAAIVRNYPDMQLDEVVEMIDLANYRDVLDATMNVSGFRQSEGPGTGEAVPASTGTSSTPS